jgi:UDP-GlcNAc:undecaprenyl-phosphate GlcNAc-1-phosphate transferase
VATPVLRRVAIAIDFVDKPNTRKSHSRVVPYMGGVAIMVATIGGTIVGPFAGGRAILLLAGAAVLGLIGLIDDWRGLGALGRLAAEFGMAAVAYAFDVRAVATGIPWLDLVITLVWIAGITNAFNFFDNMDGLSSGTGVSCGISIFVLAALGGQYRIATIAIGLAGACLAFLAYNFRPAMIFMGDSGALFLGFLLATLTLQVAPDVAPPASFLVPFFILAVPVLDTSTVVLDRFRHGRSPLVGGKDHLSHRLVARGLSRELAVLFLIGAELVLGLIAAAIGRHAVPLALGAAAGVAVIALVAMAAVPGRMYSSPRRPLPRKLKLAVSLLGALTIMSAVPAIIGLIEARGPLNLAAGQAQAAVAAARTGDVDGATSLFAKAKTGFTLGHEELSGPVRSLGLAVPGLSSNLRAARVLADTGRDLSAAGVAIATTADPESLAVVNGKIDLAALGQITDELREADAVLRSSTAAVRSINYPYLVPQMRNAVDRLDRELTAAEGDTSRAFAAAEIAPLLLGQDAPRRYFLAVQNNAEARATGGFIGNFGEIVADGGELRVDRFGRIGDLNPAPTDATPRTLEGPEDFVARYARFGIERTWQNVNVSPDLSVVAGVIANLYPKSGGKPVDGVIAIDPVGLAALLQLTGPVEVAPWPEPLTTENVVDVTLKQAYARFPIQEQRVEFLGDVADQIVRTVTRGSLGSPARIVRVLAPAVAGGHLRLATVDEPSAKVLRRLGLSGAVPASPSDSLVLTTQNAAGNKVDVYLRRSVVYDLMLTPSTNRATVRGKATIALFNDLPDAPLPVAVIGPYDDRYLAGENRTFLSLYSPLGFRSAKLEGRTTGLETARELGRNVYSSFVSIPSNEKKTLAVQLDGSVPLAGGWYELDLVRQPALTSDVIDLQVRVADGWRVRAVEGAPEATWNSRSVSGTFDLAVSRTVRVRLERRAETNILRRLLSPSSPG